MADMGVLLQLVWNEEWPEFISTMGGLSFCSSAPEIRPLKGLVFRSSPACVGLEIRLKIAGRHVEVVTKAIRALVSPPPSSTSSVPSRRCKLSPPPGSEAKAS